MAPTVDIDALAVRVLERVLDVLRASRTFSTRKGEAPPGYSRDGWRALAKQIGTKRGRHLYVDAATLAAHEGRATTVAASPPAEPWSPAQAAEALGLRLVGGAR